MGSRKVMVEIVAKQKGCMLCELAIAMLEEIDPEFDVAIVAAAPARFLVAGMGDALSTWFEARSCERTRSPNECGGRGTATGFAIARLCYETLLSHGVAARRANERHLVTPALERIVEANTLMSGIGFESAGLATAHSVPNGLTVLPETHAFYHGEKVAFGVLAGLHLTDAPAAEVAAVYAFCEGVGLPTSLAEVGLGQADRRRLAQAAEKACEKGSPIHHEAGVVTPGRVLEAGAYVEKYGEQWGTDLALRTYLSTLVGLEDRLVLHGGGNNSVQNDLYEHPGRGNLSNSCEGFRAEHGSHWA